MLNEHSREALERTERCTVDHHRSLFGVVFSSVLQLKALWQIVVYLNGTQLPFTADGILHHEVEFRAIEGSLAHFLMGVQSFLLTSLTDCVLTLLPDFVRTDVLLGIFRVAQRDLGIVVIEAKDTEHLEDDVDDRLKLSLHLIRTHKDVGIVLCERTYASQSVQLTALLIAEHSSELCNAEWQIFVATGLAGIHLTVVRTVHRFEHVLLIGLRCMDRLESILAIVSIVTRGNIEVL